MSTPICFVPKPNLFLLSMKVCIIKKSILPKCTKTLLATIPNLRPSLNYPSILLSTPSLVQYDECVPWCLHALYSFDGTQYIWHSSHVNINPFHVLHSFDGMRCNWHPFHVCINPFNASFLHPWTCSCVTCAFRKRMILHIRHKE
jgi:hypothetical protein